MNPYRLRVLASLMGATPRQVETILAERDAEAPHGMLSFAGAYKALRRNPLDSARALQGLERWRDDNSVKPRTSAFRRNAFPNLKWCAEEALPKIRRVVKVLDGDRQKDGMLLELGGVAFTGGFHMLAEWDDGTERLVYFLGPYWPRKRIRKMMALLQMKAVQVYGREPQVTVVIDIKRREIHELRDLDPADRAEAERTVAWLLEYMRDRPAA